jgi:hypothetical protein
VSVLGRMTNVPSFRYTNRPSPPWKYAIDQRIRQPSCWPDLSSALSRHDVAGLGFIIEMQLDSTGFELTQHDLDALLDRSTVRAVAGDEFLDNGLPDGPRNPMVQGTKVDGLTAA